SNDKSSPSPLLVLTQLNNDNGINHFSNVKKEAGLYHFAILLPERKYLASFLCHLQKNLDTQYYEGMADHAVSESIYIHDPDYNGIEIYRDRLPSEWKWNGNKIHMVTEPLHVTNLLNQNSNEIWKGLSPNTSIGHVHLHVSNLIRAKKFYDVLGLNHTASYPGAYFFAANGYHHHVATNTWMGTNILPANNNNDQNKSGLDHYAIIISEAKEEEIANLKTILSVWEY
ncbi:MAG: glyoxalase, partial [Candidatus Nitrosocosmicus sp.]